MAYAHTNSKGVKYYLNEARSAVADKSGKKGFIYYFSKDDRSGTTGCDAIPAGKEVSENPRNGALFLRNKK